MGKESVTAETAFEQNVEPGAQGGIVLTNAVEERGPFRRVCFLHGQFEQRFFEGGFGFSRHVVVVSLDCSLSAPFRRRNDQPPDKFCFSSAYSQERA